MKCHSGADNPREIGDVDYSDIEGNCGRSRWRGTFWQRLARLVCRQKREVVYSAYRLVKANQAELPVRALCETLQVPTSGYYAWRDRPPSKRGQASTELSEFIAGKAFCTWPS